MEWKTTGEAAAVQARNTTNGPILHQCAGGTVGLEPFAVETMTDAPDCVFAYLRDAIVNLFMFIYDSR